MSYIVLARKYRPQSFAEVYAQDHVTEILQNAIESKRIAHAFLFTGPRGVGKTSMARILAKSLNCVEGPSAHPCNKCHNCLEITAGTSPDVIEIDGASNTSVDDVRDLQKELLYAPSQSLYKIYIIDEVHMLSKSAFNALLKTLEEPPENVLFIFATTEAQKVLPTIVSRCQRYDFKRIPVEAIVRRLKEITDAEGITIDNDSLYIIARKADGGMRDALSLLDQVLSYCLNDVTIDKVREIFGMIPNQVYSQLFMMVKQKDSAQLISTLHKVLDDGMDPQELLINMTEFIRVVLLRKSGVAPPEVASDEYPLFDDVAAAFSQADLLYLISALIQARVDLRGSLNPQLLLEVLMLKLSRMDEMKEISQLIEMLKEGDGGYTPAPAVKVSTATAQPKPAPAPTAPAPTPAATATPVQASQTPAPQAAPQPSSREAVEFNIENINANMEKLKIRFKRISNATSIAFSDAQIVRAENGVLELGIKSPAFYSTLNNQKDEVELQLSDFFGKPIRMILKQIKNSEPHKLPDSRRNINNLKEKDPILAEYINLTNSKLGAGS